MWLDVFPFGVAHHMALVPAVALLCWRRQDAGLWWLAAAFGVSWLADTASHWVAPFLISAAYPVGQTGLAAGALLPKREASGLVLVAVLTALGAILWHGVAGPDYLARAIAWGAIMVAAAQHGELGLIRTALVVYFGAGLLLWAAYTAMPGWTTWGAYQGARAVGLGLFSFGVWRMR